MLQAGARAPEFTLESDGGAQVSLSQYQGRKVVLYFYPKDDTSGCTTEACEFRDAWREIQAAGVVVLGVSPDSAASHDRFKAKHRLPFSLLSDPDHSVAKGYGTWGEKSLYGRKYFGLIRATFLIDEAGQVVRVWPRVKPKGHAAEVLAALRDGM